MTASLETPTSHLDRIYAGYADARPHHPAPASAEDLIRGKEVVFRKFFGPLFPAQKDAAILDIGCGYGELLYFLQREGYTNTQGIDLNAQQVAVGSALGVRNIQYGDSRKFLAEADHSFDFVSAIDVLEHIPKNQVLEFLDLVHSALSPGGTFLCQVPNLAAFYTPLFYMDFSHETPFTPSSLKQALQIAGFANVRVSAMGPVTHGAKSAIRFLLWKGISAGLRFIQTVEGGLRDPADSIYTAAIFAAAEKR
ncbi:MAG TPA: class I SAM-dependent methyltransferase [Terriglobia bacterium]|nr:class I SAM-dependent methyltransferase [Terriglobia bacterium]